MTPLALAAIAGTWIVHPRRTADNVRAFRRELHATAPPYRMNPQTSQDTNSP